MYGRVSGPGVRPYLPRAALDLRTPANPQSVGGVGVSTSFEVVPMPGGTVFVSGLLELQM